VQPTATLISKVNVYTEQAVKLAINSNVCSGPLGVPGFPGWRGVRGPAGDTGATGATGIQIQDNRRRFVRQVSGCPGTWQHTSSCLVSRFILRHVLSIRSRC